VLIDEEVLIRICAQKGTANYLKFVPAIQCLSEWRIISTARRISSEQRCALPLLLIF